MAGGACARGRQGQRVLVAHSLVARPAAASTYAAACAQGGVAQVPPASGRPAARLASHIRRPVASAAQHRSRLVRTRTSTGHVVNCARSSSSVGPTCRSGGLPRMGTRLRSRPGEGPLPLLRRTARRPAMLWRPGVANTFAARRCRDETGASAMFFEQHTLRPATAARYRE